MKYCQGRGGDRFYMKKVLTINEIAENVNNTFLSTIKTLSSGIY